MQRAHVFIKIASSFNDMFREVLVPKIKCMRSILMSKILFKFSFTQRSNRDTFLFAWNKYKKCLLILLLVAIEIVLTIIMFAFFIFHNFVNIIKEMYKIKNQRKFFLRLFSNWKRIRRKEDHSSTGMNAVWKLKLFTERINVVILLYGETE